MRVLLWLIAAAAAVAGVRTLLLRRPAPAAAPEPFDGVRYRVGRATVLERACAAPRATVLCVHGFCEDPRYFTRCYADPDIQLILLAAADYRLTLEAPEAPAPWAAAPAHPPGTIEYDAAVLVQALEQLPRSATVRVHGHSRGGAVVLEAAAMRPELFRDVEAVLEAPVLPRAYPRTRLSRAGIWVFPFLLWLWRREPISRFNRKVWGPLDDARKRRLIEDYPFNGSAATYVRNIESMAAWVELRDYDLYRHLHRGTLLVPGDDQVLEPDSMEASARRADGRLAIVRLDGCSHFVALDRPEAIPPLASRRAANAAPAS